MPRCVAPNESACSSLGEAKHRKRRLLRHDQPAHATRRHRRWPISAAGERSKRGEAANRTISRPRTAPTAPRSSCCSCRPPARRSTRRRSRPNGCPGSAPCRPSRRGTPASRSSAVGFAICNVPPAAGPEGVRAKLDSAASPAIAAMIQIRLIAPTRLPTRPAASAAGDIADRSPKPDRTVVLPIPGDAPQGVGVGQRHDRRPWPRDQPQHDGNGDCAAHIAQQQQPSEGENARCRRWRRASASRRPTQAVIRGTASSRASVGAAMIRPISAGSRPVACSQTGKNGM